MVVLSKAYRLPLVLALLCCLVAVVLALQWYYVTKSEQVLKQQFKKPINSTVVLADPPEDNLQLGDESTFEEMMVRPLFIASRRPLPKKQDETVVEKILPAAPLSELAIKFTGFVNIPDRMIALVQDVKTRKYHRLHKGEQIHDWVLTELYPDKVVFKQGTAVEEILLRPPKPLAKNVKQANSSMRRGRSPIRKN
ncbi:MAG: hypothetical protein V3V22_09435 [Methylococcales bacterium]